MQQTVKVIDWISAKFLNFKSKTNLQIVVDVL